MIISPQWIVVLFQCLFELTPWFIMVFTAFTKHIQSRFNGFLITPWSVTKFLRFWKYYYFTLDNKPLRVLLYTFLLIWGSGAKLRSKPTSYVDYFFQIIFSVRTMQLFHLYYLDLYLALLSQIRVKSHSHPAFVAGTACIP